mgnify:CR=1 FL=1
MAKLSKRVRAMKEKVDPEKLYPLDEAVGLLKDLATAKFNETVEVAVNLGIDARKSDQAVRGATTLPHGTGSDVRVAVFTQGEAAEKATAAGADLVGMEELGEQIKGGMMDFDVVIASRFQPGAQEIGVPPFRVFLSHFSSAVIRTLVRYPGVRDYTCGFRAYRSKTLHKLIGMFDDNFIRENGFSCMFELLLNLRALRARVSEVPLVLRYDLKEGASKMPILRTMWRYVITLTRGFLPLSWRIASGREGASNDKNL